MNRPNLSRLEAAGVFGVALIAILAAFSVNYGQTNTADPDQQTNSRESNVKGLVLDGYGAVIPAAAIKFESEETDAVYETISGDQGQFGDYLKPGRYKLTVSAPGFETKSISGIVADSEKAVMIVVDLMVKEIRHSGPRILQGDENIVGIVADIAGRAIANATIRLYRDGSRKRVKNTKSNEFGEFLFKKIEPGEYLVVVTAKNFLTTTVQSIRVESDEPAELEITLLQENGRNWTITEDSMIDFRKTDMSVTVYRRGNEE